MERIGIHTKSKLQPTVAREKSPFFSFGQDMPATALPFFQPKLSINAPDDVYEKEADAMADNVVKSSSVIQRKCSSCENEEPIKTLRLKPMVNSISCVKNTVNGSKQVNGYLEAALAQSHGGGSGLPAEKKSEMEAKFGAGFGDVKIHSDGNAAALSKQLNARAFTMGNDIYFNSGEYSTGTKEGKHLLAHELTHVLQQSHRSPIIQRAEVDDNPSFCFPLDGSPQLNDAGSMINGWIDKAAADGKQQNQDAPEAIIEELATLADPLTTVIEKRIAGLPPELVRHVTLAESRYNVNRLGREYYKSKGKSPVAPVINLCGTCVGVDKVGHFFQQGGEYYNIGEALRKTLPDVLPPDIQNMLIENFTEEYGKYLEGMPNKLTNRDVLWLKMNNLIPKTYFQGIYGRWSSGVMSSADLEANKQGGRFFRDVMEDPDQPADICNYVNDNWNERFNPNTYGGSGMFTLKTSPEKDLSLVYFDTGSAVPDSNAINNIAYNISAYSDNLKQDKYHIKIEGYASRLGSSEFNQTLSENRAKAVKEQLEIALGQMINIPGFKFNDDLVEVIGNGDFWADFDEDKPANDDSQEDRVVEVKFRAE